MVAIYQHFEINTVFIVIPNKIDDLEVSIAEF
jgi:hypothetical protein